MIEILGKNRTLVRELRDKIYNSDSYRNGKMKSSEDYIMLSSIIDSICSELHLNRKDYIIDLWSAAFFTKDEAKNGAIVKYRKQLGLIP